MALNNLQTLICHKPQKTNNFQRNQWWFFHAPVDCQHDLLYWLQCQAFFFLESQFVSSPCTVLTTHGFHCRDNKPLIKELFWNMDHSVWFLKEIEFYKLLDILKRYNTIKNIYVHMCVYIYIYIYTYIYVCVFVCVCAHMYSCVYMCVCIYLRTV